MMKNVYPDYSMFDIRKNNLPYGMMFDDMSRMLGGITPVELEPHTLYSDRYFRYKLRLDCYEAFICSQAVGDLKFDKFRRQMFAGFHRDSRII